MLKRFSSYFAQSMMQSKLKEALKIERLDAPVTYATDASKPYLLYMHVPFCHDFCPFCSFHKFKYDALNVKSYFRSLREELFIVKRLGFSFDRLYIGGGTPFVDPKELFQTIRVAKELFDIKEVSCESSPASIDRERVYEAKGLIDRLSIGVQTFDDTLLKRMGRYERYGSSKELQRKIESLQGILPTISLDLIFNFPAQSEAMLREDLRIAKALGSEQITTYLLMRSSLMKESIKNTFGEDEGIKEWMLYQAIRDEMSEYNLNNAWAFAKEKSALSDEYVVHYPEYVGVGSGAFSAFNDRLYVNAYSLSEYLQRIKEQRHAIIAQTPVFSFKQQVQYAFLLELFSRSLDMERFNTRFGICVEKMFSIELWWLESNHAIRKEGGVIYTTLFGDYLCATMMKTFYSGMDLVRAYLSKTFYQNAS